MEQEALPRCVRCHRKFQSEDSLQRYCCRNHHEGQRRHSEDCRSVLRGPRALRKLLGDESAFRLEPLQHLVACGEDQACLFLQLALYAERAGKLDDAAKDEVCQRFVKQFGSAVESLPLWCQQEGESAESLLLKAWERVKAAYRVPSTPDGFSRYAHRMIHIMKRDPRPQNEVLAESVGIDLDGERIVEDILKKRKEEYSIREAAALVGIEERTFYKLVKRGRIPAQRKGRSYTLLPSWELEACKWKEEERQRLCQSGLNKIYALAWEMRRGLRRSGGTPEEISPSAHTQIKRWHVAKMTEVEIKERIGDRYFQRATKEASKYLTTQEIDAIYYLVKSLQKRRKGQA